jgi:hypothetical protein
MMKGKGALELTMKPRKVTASGIALDYYTGQRINGNITVLPLEHPEFKSTAQVTNGEWSMSFDLLPEDVEHMTFIVESVEKEGYNQMKLPTPSTAKPSCTVQNISLSGYSLDVNGQAITSGNVRVSVLDTDYMNTTSFTGGSWSIDFHPCLISGQLYTLQILVSDDTGRRGEILQKYPGK